MSRFDLEGVVFDVDGVLFDTERLSQETWNAVSTELNWPQVGRAYLEFVGQNRADILQKMLDLFGPDFPRETFLLTCSARSQARMEQEGVPLKPGVREILEFLTARGIPAALATSTNRERGGRFVRGSVRLLEASQRRCNFELWRLSLSRAGSRLDICTCITILV